MTGVAIDHVRAFALGIIGVDVADIPLLVTLPEYLYWHMWPPARPTRGNAVVTITVFFCFNSRPKPEGREKISEFEVLIKFPLSPDLRRRGGGLYKQLY